MQRRALHFSHRIASALAGLTLLAGCLAPTPPLKPQSRPAGLVKPAPRVPAPAGPSAASADLAQFYLRRQNDLQARGLLRTDGGGPDTQFGPDDLVRNFERIAFFNEHARGGLGRSDGSAGVLYRWARPVRFGTAYGASVPPATRARDDAVISSYAARLARATGHPISMSGAMSGGASANFHVLVAGHDDAAFIRSQVLRLAPDISPATLNVLLDPPRAYRCLVLSFEHPDNSHTYRMAIALIRAENSDFMQRACVHEELAQGLGLGNDSPRARPSIFNDDYEFAFLTTHDEMLLKMLYDPRLAPGMSLDQARPIAQTIAAELTGSNS